jgi:hypothetical protein
LLPKLQLIEKTANFRLTFFKTQNKDIKKNFSEFFLIF